MKTKLANKIAIVFQFPAEVMAQLFLETEDMETRNDAIIEIGTRIYRAYKRGDPFKIDTILEEGPVLHGLTRAQVEEFAAEFMTFVREQYVLTTLPPKP